MHTAGFSCGNPGWDSPCPAPQNKGLTELSQALPPLQRRNRGGTNTGDKQLPHGNALPNVPILLPETRSLREGEAPTSSFPSFSLQSHERSLLHSPRSLPSSTISHCCPFPKKKTLGNQGIIEVGKDLCDHRVWGRPAKD